MPTYDYLCPKGHRFDLFQRMSDEPGTNCPECGLAAERQISGGAGFLFKGDGFYITDSRSDDYKKKASADAATASGTESSSSSSSGSSDSGSKDASPKSPKSPKPTTSASSD